MAPSLRNSVAIAAIRSVSLTRQLAILVSVVVPSANSAATASVIAASGMWLQSSSMPFSRPSSRSVPRTSIQLSPAITLAPIRFSASAKRTSPWILDKPTPSTRTGPPPIAPAARKYDAVEASPST
ncbi:hypothetical protein D3C87_1570920 [compost metagenome]